MMRTQQPPGRWLAHTQMTDPADHAALIDRLPSEVAMLNRVVQGLVVHCEWLGQYGNDSSAFGTISRTTLPVRQRLTALVERDGLAIDNRERSSWDTWRQVPPESRTVSPEVLTELDHLARNPEAKSRSAVIRRPLMGSG